MATYVNDLRLKEIATGDEAGTWGTSTNTNLELIGEALGYGTQNCFASDADATTTVADGAPDPARAMYFKVTSSATLTATRTLTIAPNTISRVMLIENATTGSQSITISQGSGSTVTIASGAVKMVYLDGAGAGGAVVEALADLELPTITVADLTATTADINGGTIDGTVIGGSTAAAITGTTITGTSFVSSGDMTFGDSDKAVFGAGSDLQIYHDGTNSVVGEVGTGNLYVQSNGAQILLQPIAGEQGIVVNSNADVGIYYDNSLKLATTATGIDVTGTVTADGLTVDGGNTIRLNASSGDDFLTIEQGTSDAKISANSTAGNANLQFFTTSVGSVKQRVDIATNGDISFYEDTGTTPKFFWDASAESLGIGTTSPAQKAHIYESTAATGAFLQTQEVGGQNAYFGVNTSGGSIQVSGAYPLQIATNGAERMRIDASGNVGIGVSSPSPSCKLHIKDGSGADAIALIDVDTGAGDSILALRNHLKIWNVGIDKSDSNKLVIAQGGDFNNIPAGAVMTLDTSGQVGIGTSSPTSSLHISQSSPVITLTDSDAAGINSTIGGSSGRLAFNADANNYGTGEIIFQQAGTERARIDSTGKVGIGNTAPVSALQVQASSPVITAAQSNTLITSGELIGAFNAYSADTSTNSKGGVGGVRVFASSTYDTGNTPSHLSFWTHPDSANNNTELGGALERARIDSSGNLLVGTTSAAAKLTVEQGSANTNGANITNQSFDYQTLGLHNTATSGDNLLVSFVTDASSFRGSISFNRAGGLVAYNTTSDYRAKDIIGAVTDSGSVIDATPVYMGKMKGATQERPMFIAHEVPAYAHTGEKDAVDADGNPIYQQMDVSALVPVMWAEIQSLRARVAQLEGAN